LQSNALLALTVTPTADVPACRAVGYDGALVDATGARVFGVSQYMIPAGRAGAVTVVGTATIEAGAAVAVGDALIADDQGRAIPAAALAIQSGVTTLTSTLSTGNFVGAILPQHIFGGAMEVAAVAGQYIQIFLRA
jgi:hypothetical protein